MDLPPYQAETSGDAALFSLGILRGEEAQRVETRLRSGCEFCLREAAQHDRAAGESLAAMVTPVEPPSGLKARLMARLSEAGAVDGRKVVRGGEAGWRRGPVAGSRIKPLQGGATFLLELEAGATFPPHDHDRGHEQCLVLSGSVRSGDLTVAAGDYLFMPQGSHHDALETDEGCVLLIAYS